MSENPSTEENDMTIQRLTLFTLFTFALMALALPVAAKDKTITIVDDQGETYICTYIEGERLHVVHKESGEEILDFDFEELENTIEDALEDVAETLEELEGLDFDFHIGDQSYVRFEHGDERVFLDVDGIIAGIMGVVENLSDLEIDLGEIHVDRDDDADHRDQVRREIRHIRHEADPELRDELEELRREVMELKNELRQAERRNRH